jgi:glycosyltransferase involved in cell wall biosynthesis
MRVGLDGYPLCGPLTGVGHYTLELSRALALNNAADQFELIAPFDFHPAVAAQLARESISNLSLVNLGLTNPRRRWWSYHLPRYLKRSTVDLFHGTNYELPLWPTRRAVVTVHDLSSLLYPELHRQRLARRMRLRLPLAVKMAQAIITPTEAVKRELCARLKVKPAKVTAIHEAPREAFHPAGHDDSFLIRQRLGIQNDFLLFVGTLEPRKNLLTLVKAFSQILRETNLRPQLVVAGGQGWLMDETFSAMCDEEIRAHLCLTGYLNDDELRALYSSCRAFIYPSLYEGFGLPPLEAMACGAPVIASRIPALQETLSDAAILIDPLDVDALTRAIIGVLNDDGHREQIGAGNAHVKRFSWEQAARITYEIYSQVLK